MMKDFSFGNLLKQPRRAQYMTEGELRLSLGDRIQYEGPNGMATGTFVDRYTQEQDPLHGGGGPMLVVEEDGGPEVTIAPQDVIAKIASRKLVQPRQMRADILRSVGVINDYWDAMREHLDSMWGSEKRGDLWPQLMKFISYRMPEPDFQRFDSQMRSGDIAGGIEMLLQESGIHLLARQAQGKSYRVDEWEGQSGSEQLVNSGVITIDDPMQWLNANYSGWRIADLGDGEYIAEDPQVTEAGGYSHQIWIEPAEKAARRKEASQFNVGETYEALSPPFQYPQKRVITDIERGVFVGGVDKLHYKIIKPDGEEVPPLSGQTDWWEGSDMFETWLREGSMRKVGSRTAGEVYTVGDPSLDIDNQPLSEGDKVNWDGIVGTIANFPMYGLAVINFPVGQLRQVGIAQEPPIRVPTDELKKMSCRQPQWNDLHRTQTERKAQATEDEQAFAEQISQQIVDFAGTEKDVGQLIELIKGKAFTGEEKDAAMPGVSMPTPAGPSAAKNATVNHVMSLYAQGKSEYEIECATVLDRKVINAIIRAHGRKSLLESEIQQALQIGLKPQLIASLLNLPIEIVAELVDKEAQVPPELAIAEEVMRKMPGGAAGAGGGGGSKRPPSAADAAQQMIKKIQPHFETPKQPSVPEQEPAGEAGW